MPQDTLTKGGKKIEMKLSEKPKQVPNEH